MNLKKLALLLFAPLVLSQAPVIPLEGLDPVALIQGQQLDGDKKFSVTRGGFQYLFATADNKATFEKDPARYEIQLGGSCARMGPRTGGNGDLYSVIDHKIYVFGSAECKKRFEAAPAKYLESSQPPLPALQASPEAAAAARKLLARAVEAAGGAKAVDGVPAFQETIVRGNQEQVRTVVFPDRQHTHRVFNKQFTADEVVDGASGFGTSSGGTRDLAASAVVDIQKEARRSPLAVLRARNESSLRAAAIDDHTADIDWAGQRMVLRFDPTGRLVSLRYFGRGPEGVWGQVEYQYSDFRKTGDLTLPYQIAATFDGQPLPGYTQTITAILLNPPLPPSLFARPK
jgi:YHS domain-containing protein